MSKILSSLFSGVGNLGSRHDDDAVDRLVSRYSTIFFLTLGAIVTGSTYVGNAIDCWCPAQFTSSHVAYTNAMCLISPTYYVPRGDDIPKVALKEAHINFYIWVPFILIAQGLMCAFPGLVWKSAYRSVGINIPSLVERLNNSQALDFDRREVAVKFVVEHIHRYALTFRGSCCKWSRGSDWWCMSKHSGNYMTSSYLAVKLLYVIVVIGQFVMLNFFLGKDYHFYGLEALGELMSSDGHGLNWFSMEHRFPRVTLCNYGVRHQGVRVHNYIVQCTLPINLFNEKIFLFVWFWLALLSGLTVYSLLSWSYHCLFWQPQIYNVKYGLKYMEVTRPKDYREAVVEFTTKRMRRDSLFMIRLLRNNVGALTTAEVLKGLWEKHYHPEPTCPMDNCGATPGDLHRRTFMDIAVEASKL